MQLLTNSEGSCFRECARKHYYRYNQLRRPTTAASTLTFGRAAHEIMTMHWSKQPVEATLLRVAQQSRGMVHDEKSSFVAAKYEATMLGYLAYYENDTLDVKAVAQIFRVPLRNPLTGRVSQTWELGGEFDGVVEPSGARRLLLEGKTSGEDITPGSTYWKRLRMDTQASIYINSAEEHFGCDLDGIQYDVVGKSALRPRKSDTPEAYRDRIMANMEEKPEKYFQRAVVLRTYDERKEAAHDIWMTAKMLRESQKADLWPRSPGACFRWNRACEYFDVCSGTDDLGNDINFRTAETKHEELHRDTE